MSAIVTNRRVKKRMKTRTNNWNSARWETRDRLLDYEASLMPPALADLDMGSVYPWHTQSLRLLDHMLYQIAKLNGFEGDEEEFNALFFGFAAKQQIIFSPFPEEGEEGILYFNLEDKTLYYWDETEYRPVNAMLMADVIINGGSSLGLPENDGEGV